MKNQRTILTLKDEHIQENPFITKDGRAAFYRFIGELFVGNYDDIKAIDCTKINVATNIQEAWFNYAKENGIEESELSMLLLFNGPKAVKSLEPNSVELEAGAIEV